MPVKAARAEPPPGPPPAPARPHAPPVFGTDERLDLPALESHAARLQVLAWLSLIAGVLAAGAVGLFSSRSQAERTLLACALLFGATVAWACCAAARAAALAAVSLAQRQREILRSL